MSASPASIPLTRIPTFSIMASLAGMVQPGQACCALPLASRHSIGATDRLTCGRVGEAGRAGGRALVVRAAEEDEFEARLSKLRKKGGSGTGKKAEERKMRKEGASGESGSSSSSSAGAGAASRSASIEALPPVPIQEPMSEGLPVLPGFSPYAERLNGRAALLGLVALLAVELATGEGLFKYHDAATVGVQLYFLAGAGALYIKFDKEKDSVWPS